MRHNWSLEFFRPRGRDSDLEFGYEASRRRSDAKPDTSAGIPPAIRFVQLIVQVQTARSGCRPGLQSESDVRRDRFPSRFESGGRRA